MEESIVCVSGHIPQNSPGRAFFAFYLAAEAPTLGKEVGLGQIHVVCHMKKILLASVATAALCSASALAADMPVKAPHYAPSFSWTGCYVGAVAGGMWGSTRQVDESGKPSAIGLPLIDTDVSGGLVGGTLGCNYQTANWVWGVENDISWTSFKGSEQELDPFNPNIRLGTKTSWLDTLRGRVGYAVDRSLWYVTGGAAFSDIKATEDFPGVGNITNTRTGWTVGAGVEWALADPHWSVKLEYLYVDFGNKLYRFTAQPVPDLDRNVNLKENIVRVGLNYKLDWGKAPVVAKY
jgi:outer membrane immunogenic protein